MLCKSALVASSKWLIWGLVLHVLLIHNKNGRSWLNIFQSGLVANSWQFLYKGLHFVYIKKKSYQNRSKTMTCSDNSFPIIIFFALKTGCNHLLDDFLVGLIDGCYVYWLQIDLGGLIGVVPMPSLMVATGMFMCKATLAQVWRASYVVNGIFKPTISPILFRL